MNQFVCKLADGGGTDSGNLYHERGEFPGKRGSRTLTGVFRIGDMLSYSFQLFRIDSNRRHCSFSYLVPIWGIFLLRY
ncbi:hypothetical protein PspKH34_23350 [Parageobacillus sp. KH3-4]|nr:hypothetical protein PspKH34_23350 [Parageobacillus sp. KH3-4]